MPELITIGETMAVMTPAEAGPLRYVSNYHLRMAGAESNVAIGLSKLKHSAGWISCLGEDEMGYFVQNAIRAEGVDTTRVRFDPEHRTGLMFKQFSAGETTVFYYRENSAASHLVPSDLDASYLRTATILHLTGITPVLSQSCLETIVAAANFAKENRIILSFDPNIRRKLWKKSDYAPLMRQLLFASDIALLGKDEAEFLLGVSDPRMVVSVLRAHGTRWIALKDGSQGAWVADADQIFHIPPYPCHVVDPIGAGDGFNAGFLAGILEQRDLLTCGQMGAVCGALATETAGDIEGYPSRLQLAGKLAETKEIYR